MEFDLEDSDMTRFQSLRSLTLVASFLNFAVEGFSIDEAVQYLKALLLPTTEVDWIVNSPLFAEDAVEPWTRYSDRFNKPTGKEGYKKRYDEFWDNFINYLESVLAVAN